MTRQSRHRFRPYSSCSRRANKVNKQESCEEDIEMETEKIANKILSKNFSQID